MHGSQAPFWPGAKRGTFAAHMPFCQWSKYKDRIVIVKIGWVWACGGFKCKASHGHGYGWKWREKMWEEGVQSLWGGLVGAEENMITRSTARGDHMSRPSTSCRHAQGHDMLGHVTSSLPTWHSRSHVSYNDSPAERCFPMARLGSGSGSFFSSAWLHSPDW